MSSVIILINTDFIISLWWERSSPSLLAIFNCRTTWCQARVLLRTLECRKLLLHLTKPLDPLAVPSLSPLTHTLPKLALITTILCSISSKPTFQSPPWSGNTHKLLFMPGLFHLTQCPLVTSMHLQRTSLYCGYTEFHCVWYSTVLCLLYSSFDGQLGGFCMLALGSRATTIVVVQMSS